MAVDDRADLLLVLAKKATSLILPTCATNVTCGSWEYGCAGMYSLSVSRWMFGHSCQSILFSGIP